MQLSGIISISGKSGLSKIVSQTRTGLIVESLSDGKRSAVHGAERVSSLEDISIYTYEEDMLLTEVFQKMYDAAQGEKVISHKSSTDELKSYLKSILENYDEDRVYVSDIKKLVQWFNILQEKGILKEEIEKAKEEEKAEGKEKSTEKKEITAAKKSPAKPKKVAARAKAPKASGKAAPGKGATPKGASKGK